MNRCATHFCRTRQSSGTFYWDEKLLQYNLVNETNLVHDLFLVYSVNFIYNLYMSRAFPGPSSGGTTVFMRHMVLVILYS